MEPSAKKLYQSRPDYDTSTLRDDDYPCEHLARAVEESGVSYAEIAKRLGWVHPDTQRVRASLGLRKASDGKTRVAIRYENAVKIIRAIGRDPVDYGL